MIPIAVTGITLRSINILNILTNHRNKSILFSIIIIYIIYNYNNIFIEFRGFSYSRKKLNIAAICLFTSFSLFHLKK